MLNRRLLMAQGGGTPPGVLPSEYQKVQYLIGDGKAFLQTSVLPAQTITLEAGMRRERVTQFKGENMIGSRNSAAVNNITIAGTSSLEVYFDNSDWKPYRAFTRQFPLGVDLIVKSCAAERSIIGTDGKVYVQNKTFCPDSFSATIPMQIFNVAGNGVPERAGYTGKLAYVKIYDADALIMHLVPCFRKSDNELGMYDVIGQQFYTNAARGGSFTYD